MRGCISHECAIVVISFFSSLPSTFPNRVAIREINPALKLDPHLIHEGGAVLHIVEQFGRGRCIRAGASFPRATQAGMARIRPIHFVDARK